MSFTKIPTTLHDCFLIEPQVFGDARGFFMETYSTAEFEKISISTHFVQDNHSKSKKGVLRGLHFQIRKPQAKLVRVSSGAVYDVVVDLRRESPTFGKWEGFLLSAENKRQLFVPRGFAHGFLTLEDDTEFLYKCDDVYDPGYEGGLIWDDRDLQIDWSRLMEEYRISALEISQKDQKNTSFEELQKGEIFEQKYEKRWNEWISLKEKVHEAGKIHSIKEGQIWWCHMGENIGSELNGKGDRFLRPVIIYKKLSQWQFLGIPTTTQEHSGTWYVPFCHHQKQIYASLHQARIFDIRRVFNPQGTLDTKDFGAVREAFKKLYT